MYVLTSSTSFRSRNFGSVALAARRLGFLFRILFYFFILVSIFFFEGGGGRKGFVFRTGTSQCSPLYRPSNGDLSQTCVQTLSSEFHRSRREGSEHKILFDIYIHVNKIKNKKL